MASTGCPFCAVAGRAGPNVREIYRDEYTVAFFPLEPATHGHTLIVPIRHVSDVWGLRETDLTPLVQTTMKVAKAIRSALAPEGLNIIQSNGREATQTVEHFHVHLVPRWRDDRMPEIWPEGTEESDQTQDEAAREIAAALARSPLNVSQEDRRQHLALIQSVVARIVTVAYGFAVTKDSPPIAVLGIIAVLIVGLLDANYLKQERAFCALYERVARGRSIPAFSMNPAITGTEGGQGNHWPDLIGLRSWAIAPIYGPLLVSGTAIAVLQEWVW